MEKSKHLHNFKLPPGWTSGERQSSLLRCMNSNPDRAIPALDDDESSDSGEYNPKRSVENSRSRSKRFEGEEISPPLNSQTRQKLTRKAKICSEGGINAETDQDPRSDKKSARPRRNLLKKEEMPNFSLTLSRKEIEEDFIAMTGKKPPRKPNKQPKSVKMKIDAVTPGLRLSEVHPDRYKVNESGNI